MRAFFDWLLGRKTEVLWRELQNSGTQKRFDALCRANPQSISSHFAEWRTVPEDIRNDGKSVQRYAGTLMAVATYFRDRLQQPELMNDLIGTEESNPLLYWQNHSPAVAKLQSSFRFEEAEALLTKILNRLQTGTGHVTSIRAMTLGNLGTCRFELRDADSAVVYFRQALAICEQESDTEGIQAYLGNLFQAHRYRNDPEAASESALKLSGFFSAGDPQLSTWYARQAEIVRGGEPLSRVIATIGGRNYELNMLPAETEGSVKFLLYRNRLPLKLSTELTRRGDELFLQSLLEPALEFYRQAAQSDPPDPQPHYQRAFALMMSARYADAIEACHVTEELAPGWFHCREMLWMAQQLLIGKFDHEVLVTTGIVDDFNQPPKQNLNALVKVMKSFPGVASLHLRHGQTLTALDRRSEAAAAFRQGLTCELIPDVETRLCVALATVLEAGPERGELLRRAQDPEGNYVAAATAEVLERLFNRT